MIAQQSETLILFFNLSCLVGVSKFSFIGAALLLDPLAPSNSVVMVATKAKL